jgi:hypothetical protein
MDAYGNPLVIDSIYKITSKNDEYPTTKKESGIYTYKGKPYWSQGYQHEFIKQDGTKLIIPDSTLTGSNVYTITLHAGGGRRKIRKQTRKTRARRLNRRKHTRKH